MAWFVCFCDYICIHVCIYLCVSVRHKLMEEFPASSRSVIELALETCSYDENKARQLLTTFNTTKSTSTAAATTTASTDSVTYTSVTAPSSVSAADTSVTSGIMVSSSDITITVPSRPASVTAAATAKHAGNYVIVGLWCLYFCLYITIISYTGGSVV